MDNFNDRLKYAIRLRGVSQTELCQSTGIPKSAMSQYISGNFKPKQLRTYALAEALRVGHAWLTGYNVPMNWVEKNTEGISDSNSIDVELSELISKLIKTNDEWTKRFIIKLLRMPPQSREVFRAMFKDIADE